MLDLSLFRKPAFTGASIAAFALSASMFAMFLYLTLYIQNVLGYSPLQAGLRFLPLTLLSFFVGADLGRALRAPPGARLPGRRAGARRRRRCCSCAGSTPARSWTALLAGFLHRRASASG